LFYSIPDWVKFVYDPKLSSLTHLPGILPLCAGVWSSKAESSSDIIECIEFSLESTPLSTVVTSLDNGEWSDPPYGLTYFLVLTYYSYDKDFPNFLCSRFYFISVGYGEWHSFLAFSNWAGFSLMLTYFLEFLLPLIPFGEISPTPYGEVFWAGDIDESFFTFSIVFDYLAALAYALSSLAL